MAARYFNPRAPCGARRRPRVGTFSPQHFNPRAPCGARLCSAFIVHSLLYFNPRAPCGARHSNPQQPLPAYAFQSTRPMRGATHQFVAFVHHTPHFNPRAPCGARQQKLLKSNPHTFSFLQRYDKKHIANKKNVLYFQKLHTLIVTTNRIKQNTKCDCATILMSTYASHQRRHHPRTYYLQD